jgi:uncharacterized protein
MLKILLLVGIFSAIYFFLFRKKGESKRDISREEKREIESEELIPCSECGTLVSEREMLIRGGKFYCSRECAGD